MLTPSRPLLLCAALFFTAPLLAFEATETRDSCGFGLFSWCLWRSDSLAQAPASAKIWRTEVFTGYKPGMRYYEEEETNCLAKSGCEFEAAGAVFGADVYRQLSGRSQDPDSLAIGFQYSQMPVADWKSDSSFQGSLANDIQAGEGSLRYHFIRLAVKRNHFLYFLHSKYLISSFGVGLGIPEARGAAQDFVGAARPVPTIGGKLGFQYPLTASLDVGLASSWNVLWYGKSMGDSAFLAGYGINISAKI